MMDGEEGGWGVGWGGEEVVGLWLLRGGAMNIVDKLTPNSKTVVNTEEKKTFWMLLILLLNHAKKEKEKNHYKNCNA